MAIGGGSLIEIVLRGLWQGQVVMNAWQYNVNANPGPADAVNIAEAWWNHVKVGYRGLAYTTANPAFTSVFVRELNNVAGEYGEFNIPLAEQAGTRSTTGAGDALPPNVTVSARLTVGSRVTRPGQKRFSYLGEGDNTNGFVSAGILTAVQTLMNTMVATMTLGAPAALTVLQPIVVRKDATGFVIADQDVTGYVVNGLLTTQNTRKIGRGI